MRLLWIHQRRVRVSNPSIEYSIWKLINLKTNLLRIPGDGMPCWTGKKHKCCKKLKWWHEVALIVTSVTYMTSNVFHMQHITCGVVPWGIERNKKRNLLDLSYYQRVPWQIIQKKYDTKRNLLDLSYYQRVVDSRWHNEGTAGPRNNLTNGLLTIPDTEHWAPYNLRHWALCTLYNPRHQTLSTQHTGHCKVGIVCTAVHTAHCTL